MASLRQLRQSTFNEVDWALGERHNHNQQLLSDARNTTGPPRVAGRSDQARQLQQQHQQSSQFASLPHTMHEPQDLQARDALRMMAYQDYQRELQASTQQPTLPLGGQVRNSNNNTGHRRVQTSATNNNAPSSMRSGRSHASRTHDGPNDGDDDYEALLQLDDNNVSRGITEETQQRVLLRAADWDGIQEVAKRHKVKVDQDSSSTCVICQESIIGGTQCRAGGRGSSSAVNAKKNTTAGLSLMPCGHVFHTQCLTPWLLQDRRCPTCRKECYHKATVPL